LKGSKKLKPKTDVINQNSSSANDFLKAAFQNFGMPAETILKELALLNGML